MAIVTRLLASFLLVRDLSQSQLNHGFFLIYFLYYKLSNAFAANYIGISFLSLSFRSFIL